MLSNTILPEGNLLPGSLYLMRKVLGVKSPADYEYHACPANKCWWEPLPKNQWRADPSCTCACGHPRFHEVPKAGGRNTVEPTGRVSRGRGRRARVLLCRGTCLLCGGTSPVLHTQPKRQVRGQPHACLVRGQPLGPRPRASRASWASGAQELCQRPCSGNMGCPRPPLPLWHALLPPPPCSTLSPTPSRPRAPPRCFT